MRKIQIGTPWLCRGLVSLLEVFALRSAGGPRLHRRTAKVFQVLNYHRVAPERDGVFDPIPPEMFEQQVRHLSRCYRLFTAGEAARRAIENSLPSRAVVITLDDGYADNHAYALPILKKYNAPATLFLSTGPLDGGRPLWHDRLFAAFAKTDRPSVSWQSKEWVLTSAEDRWRACQQVAASLRRCDEDRREAVLDRLCRTLGVDADRASIERSPMLSWDQVHGLMEGGVEIGAHTVTHPILSRLPPTRQREEIVAGMARIEQETGIAATSFAYPNGREDDFNGTTVQILRENGIACAYTTVFGVNDGKTDPYRLYRGAAWARTPLKFALQMVWYRFLGDVQ